MLNEALQEAGQLGLERLALEKRLAEIAERQKELSIIAQIAKQIERNQAEQAPGVEPTTAPSTGLEGISDE